jgi:nucleotide-binding universal stress UspA family protein
MIAIRSILCPFDGSGFSRRALEHAAALGRWHGAKVTLLHVFTGVPADPQDGPAAWFTPLEPQERKKIVAWLADAAASAHAEGVVVEAQVVEGRPIPEILRVAKETEAGLIVLGTHGRTGFDRLLLGSVTERILRQAPCPVLTVTARAVPAYRAGRPPFERIVCPVDFSPASTRALEHALSLAQESYGRMTLMHALEQVPTDDAGTMAHFEMARFDMAGFQEAMERSARTRLQEAIPEGARDWCRPEILVARGRAWRAILQAAEERDADLIVLGVHGRNPIDVTLFGSTTQHVVRAAKCPVLVTRSGPPAA